MKITISCSMKYRDIVRDTINGLNNLGLQSLFPNLDYGDNKIDVSNAIKIVKQLAIEHYKAIKEADLVYFITPEGYMGTSCKLELGYAIANEKIIYFSEPTNDPALDCYVTKFIPINSLELFLDLN